MWPEILSYTFCKMLSKYMTSQMVLINCQRGLSIHMQQTLFVIMVLSHCYLTTHTTLKLLFSKTTVPKSFRLPIASISTYLVFCHNCLIPLACKPSIWEITRADLETFFLIPSPAARLYRTRLYFCARLFLSKRPMFNFSLTLSHALTQDATYIH